MNLLDSDCGVVGQVGLHIEGEEEVDLLLAVKLCRYLLCGDGLVHLRVFVDERRYLHLDL